MLVIWLKEIENKFNNHNHDKYITSPEFNTLAADVFNARLAHARLVMKTLEATKTVNTSLENLLKRLGKKLDLS